MEPSARYLPTPRGDYSAAAEVFKDQLQVTPRDRSLVEAIKSELMATGAIARPETSLKQDQSLDNLITEAAAQVSLNEELKPEPFEPALEEYFDKRSFENLWENPILDLYSGPGYNEPE